jgi:hypothetical protein
MSMKEISGARLTLLANSLRNNLMVGRGNALVTYRQSRPWHVMAYWLRSGSNNTGGWLKRMIAEQREWLRQPVHFRLPARHTEQPAPLPTILIGRDLTQERPSPIIHRPGSDGELLLENRRLRDVIDLLVRFGPNQFRGTRSARLDPSTTGHTLTEGLSVRL